MLSFVEVVLMVRYWVPCAAALLLSSVWTGCASDTDDDDSFTAAPPTPTATATATATATRTATALAPTPTERPEPTDPPSTRPPRTQRPGRTPVPSDTPTEDGSTDAPTEPPTPTGTPVPPIVPGDVCSEAPTIPAGIYYGDTREGAGDYDFAGCIAEGAPGPDLAYRPDSSRNDWLRARVIADGFDAAVYLVGACSGPTAGTCTATANAVAGGGVEDLRLNPVPATGAGFLVIDSVTAGVGGPYRLELSSGPGMVEITDVAFSQQPRGGNNDDAVEPGERWKVTVTLLNSSDVSIRDLVIGLDLHDDMGDSNYDGTTSATLAAGDSRTFSFQISPKATLVGTTQRFGVVMANRGPTGKWIDSFTRFIGAAGSTPIPTPTPAPTPTAAPTPTEAPTQAATPTQAAGTPTATVTPGTPGPTRTPGETPVPTPTEPPTPTRTAGPTPPPTPTLAGTPIPTPTPPPTPTPVPVDHFPNGDYVHVGAFVYSFPGAPYRITNIAETSKLRAGVTGEYTWLFWDDRDSYEDHPNDPDCSIVETIALAPHVPGSDGTAGYDTCVSCESFFVMAMSYSENLGCSQELYDYWYDDGDGGLETETEQLVGYRHTADSGWPAEYSIPVRLALADDGYQGTTYEQKFATAFSGDDGDFGPSLATIPAELYMGRGGRLVGAARQPVLMSSPAALRRSLGILPR